MKENAKMLVFSNLLFSKCCSIISTLSEWFSRLSSQFFLQKTTTLCLVIIPMRRVHNRLRSTWTLLFNSPIYGKMLRNSSRNLKWGRTSDGRGRSGSDLNAITSNTQGSSWNKMIRHRVRSTLKSGPCRSLYKLREKRSAKSPSTATGVNTFT